MEKEPKFAVCLQNTDYRASLELCKLYRLLPDKDAAQHGYLRIVDESGENYLYPENWFSPVELPQVVEAALLLAASAADLPERTGILQL